MRPFRRQMRPLAQRRRPATPPATAALITLLSCVFAIQTLFELLEVDLLFDASDRMEQWIALSGPGINAGHYWELLSYSWIHPGPLPIQMMLVVIVIFYAGREVEPILGMRHLVGIYALGNLFGGIAHWLVMPGIPLMGSAAGSAAVLAAFSTILPELEVASGRLAFGNVRLKAKHLGLGLALAACLFWCFYAPPEISPAAILAGSVLGWMYVEALGFGAPLAIQRYFFEKRQRQERLQRMSLEEFIHVEIDPILEKISHKGLQSLTRAERKILKWGREKLADKSGQALK